MKLNHSLLALAAALMTTTTPALAAEPALKSKTIPDVHRAETAEQRKPSIGFMGGYAETESRRQATTFGVDYTFQPTIPFALGGEVLGYVSHGENGSSTLTRTRLLVKGTYNFGGHIPVIKNSYVGLGLGPVFDNVQSTTDVALGIAPSIGFDIPLPDWFANWSIGANASYTFLALTPSHDFFAVNGVLKYWF